MALAVVCIVAGAYQRSIRPFDQDGKSVLLTVLLCWKNQRSVWKKASGRDDLC